MRTSACTDISPLACTARSTAEVSNCIESWRSNSSSACYLGKPWQNGLGESFQSRFRDECLNQEAFFTVHEAAILIEQYRPAYNEARPHSSLRYRTPAEVATNTRGCRMTLVRRTGAEQPGR